MNGSRRVAWLSRSLSIHWIPAPVDHSTGDFRRAPSDVLHDHVHSSTRIDHHSPKVVGSTNLPVKVYVRQHHNSPHILCLTNHLRNSELIDPIFEWHGPSGDLVTGNESVTISPTGTLLFQHFKSYMSGIYTCSLVFKPTTEQEEKSYLIKYVIYAYSDPNFYYEFTARYHSAPCNSIYNTSFEKKLLQILAKLVVELACEVSLQKSECHHVKMQRAGMQNELFFTFKEAVKGKSMCQKSVCDVSRRLRKAKDLIEKFFSQQVEVLGKRTAPLPEIYYIEGTLQMVMELILYYTQIALIVVLCAVQDHSTLMKELIVFNATE
ncbi:Zona pellucida-binding protein 1, partial [Ophiophagus hannah]